MTCEGYSFKMRPPGSPVDIDGAIKRCRADRRKRIAMSRVFAGPTASSIFFLSGWTRAREAMRGDFGPSILRAYYPVYRLVLSPPHNRLASSLDTSRRTAATRRPSTNDATHGGPSDD